MHLIWHVSSGLTEGLTDDGVKSHDPRWKGPSAWRGNQREAWIGLQMKEGKEGWRNSSHNFLVM